MRRLGRGTAVAAAGLALLAAPLALYSQEEPAERFREEVEVSEVLLDVVVTDKRGQVIVGLTPADFEVIEDGVEMEITGLTFYSSSRLLSDAAPLEAGGLDVEREPSRRYFIFFFQDQRRNAGEFPRIVARQLEAGRELSRWIEEDMLGGDLAAVLSYDLRLKIYHDFTADRAALVQAVDKAVRGVDPGTEWPSRRPEAEDGGPTLLARMPAGRELMKRSKSIYRALELVAAAAGEVRGRKNLVFFGLGFGDIDRRGRYQPDRRYFTPMVHALNDANVAVYTVDLAPLGSNHLLREALHHLASDTGGRMYYQQPRFRTALQGVEEEGRGYYLLSYRATHPAGESGYQRVRVSTRNPEFKVRARQGYLFGEGGQ